MTPVEKSVVNIELNVSAAKYLIGGLDLAKQRGRLSLGFLLGSLFASQATPSVVERLRNGLAEHAARAGL